MNQNIQDIADKVTENIEAKATPSPDPARISAVDHAEILNDILGELDNLVSAAAPVNPTGTSWYVAPGTPTIAANVITETASTLAVTTEESTTLYPIASLGITVPYAASGKKRIDAIVTAFVEDLEANYYTYDRIAGSEVDELGIAATPLLNPANMFVRWVHVTDGVIAAGPNGAVYSATINGGDPIYPGPTGNIDLPIAFEVQDSMDYDGTGTYVPTVDAVNIQTNHLATVAVHTGFIRTDDSFTLSAPDQFTLGIGDSEFGIVFSSSFITAETAPKDAVKLLIARTVALSTLASTNPIPNNSHTVFYVGWENSSDNIVFSTSSYVQNPDICQLGLVFVKNAAGVYSFTSHPTRTFINMPDVSAYSNLLTTTTGVKSNIIVSASTGMTMVHTAGVIQGISVNWQMGANNDERPVAASANPMPFTFRTPVSHLSTTVPAGITSLNPTQYWNGSAMVDLSGTNTAQVMRILISLRGTVIIQVGETEYATLAAAKSAAFRQTYTEIPNLPKNSYAEIGRIAVKKSAVSLADLTDAEIFIYGVSSGGGGTGTDVSGKADKALTINTQTASYTLALTDAAGMVRMNVASANTLTIPPNASVAFPDGTQIVWSQPGAGQTTFVAGSGVTIVSFGSALKSTGQYAGGTLVKIGTNTWELHGNITA